MALLHVWARNRISWVNIPSYAAQPLWWHYEAISYMLQSVLEMLRTRCLLWNIQKKRVDLLNYSHCSIIWYTNSSFMTFNLYFSIIINLMGWILLQWWRQCFWKEKDVNLGEDLVGWVLKAIKASDLSWLSNKWTQTLSLKYAWRNPFAFVVWI